LGSTTPAGFGVRENAVEAWLGSYHSVAAFIDWSATLSADWRAALGLAVERPGDARGPAMQAFVPLHGHPLRLGAVERDVGAERDAVAGGQPLPRAGPGTIWLLTLVELHGYSGRAAAALGDAAPALCPTARCTTWRTRSAA